MNQTTHIKEELNITDLSTLQEFLLNDCGSSNEFDEEVISFLSSVNHYSDFSFRLFIEGAYEVKLFLFGLEVESKVFYLNQVQVISEQEEPEFSFEQLVSEEQFRDAMKSDLHGIVSKSRGGFIGYAIGEEHAEEIRSALACKHSESVELNGKLGQVSISKKDLLSALEDLEFSKDVIMMLINPKVCEESGDFSNFKDEYMSLVKKLLYKDTSLSNHFIDKVFSEG